MNESIVCWLDCPVIKKFNPSTNYIYHLYFLTCHKKIQQSIPIRFNMSIFETFKIIVFH